MRFVWLILGNLWMLPNTAISALYLGVLAVFGQVYFDGTAIFQFPIWLSVRRETRLWRWMDKNGWNGWASGPFVTMRGSTIRGLKHEDRHVQQQLVFGPLHYPLYVLASVFIWIVLRDHHSYYDNPFETDARRYAGQQIDIPKSQWKDGIADRWAWW